MNRAANSMAWALGQQQRNGFHVRRVVWGLFMARAEQRDGEEIRAATIWVEQKSKAKPKAKRKADIPTDAQLAWRRSDLSYFDLLPEKLRQIVNKTDFKCSSTVLYRMWHDEGMTCEQIVKKLERDAEALARATTPPELR